MHPKYKLLILTFITRDAHKMSKKTQALIELIVYLPPFYLAPHPSLYPMDEHSDPSLNTREYIMM